MQQEIWGWLIVIYLFLGGLGAGAFVCSTLAYKGVFGNLNERFYKFGFLLAPVAVIVGTLLLVFDLAPSAAINPFKIMQLYTAPTSMMSIGTYLLTFFIIISVLVLQKIKKGEKVCDIMLSLGVILAIGVMGYTGLLLYVVKAIPLWASIWVPILFVISALSTGVSANTIATLNGGYGITHCVHKFHTILVFLETISIVILFAMASKEAAGFASIKIITSGSLSAVFWIGFVLFGLLLPLLGGMKFMLGSSNCTNNGSTAVCHNNNLTEIKSCVYNEWGVLVGGFCLRAFMIFGAVYIF